MKIGKDYSKNISLELDASPLDDEIDAVKLLVDSDSTLKILFLKENLIKGSHTPDIQVNNKLKWEIKTPEKFTNNSLERSLKTALHQSENVIFHLKNSGKTPEKNIIRTLSKMFALSKRAKKLKFISKTGKIIDIEK